MRVAFLSPCWPHDRVANGIATYVAAVREGLGELGHECLVLTPDPGEGDPGPGVFRLPHALEDEPRSVRLRIRLAGRVSRNLEIQQSSGFRILRAIEAVDRARSIDLVELEESFGGAAVIRPRVQKPVVVRLHGPHFIVGRAIGHRRDKEFWMRCAAEYHAIRRATAVSSPAHDVLERVRRFYRLPLRNARVIPNPAPHVEEEDAWRPDRAEPGRILFVGRFDRVKGADTLLEAFVQIASRRPEVRLIFVGPDAGFMQQGRTLSVEEYLRENVPESLRDRIEITGSLPADRVAAHRRRAALAVVSSRYETFSMTTLEAMAFGSPLVAPRTGGVTDLVEDRRNGLLFEPGRADDLAAKIETLLSDPGLAERLGVEARRDAATRFGRDIVAAQTEAFYREILAAG